MVESWRSPWDVIGCMTNFHARIKANVHMKNSELCPGYPDMFQFGTSTFIELEQARELLRHAFINIDANGQFRPVIFIGHAVENDIKIIKERFGFDIDALGVVVATIDTQVLATESGHVNGPWKIRLRDLLCRYDIDEKYLHNAGNDIVCTMIAAILMAYKAPTSGHSAYYKELKRYLRSTTRSRSNMVPQFGTMIFCTKCTSHQHLAIHCPGFPRCAYCRMHPTRDRSMSYNHITKHCLENHKDASRFAREKSQQFQMSSRQPQISIPLKYPIPCPLCIESTDPDRHDHEYAYGHLEIDCVHGPVSDTK
jgi:hypothetical protein